MGAQHCKRNMRKQHCTAMYEAQSNGSTTLPAQSNASTTLLCEVQNTKQWVHNTAGGTPLQAQ
eukprot:4552361-Alexandrium_andersonii.AAC.1